MLFQEKSGNPGSHPSEREKKSVAKIVKLICLPSVG
jgi:hypothetical protein